MGVLIKPQIVQREIEIHQLNVHCAMAPTQQIRRVVRYIEKSLLEKITDMVN